jgi:hypothetical protein
VLDNPLCFARYVDISSTYRARLGNANWVERGPHRAEAFHVLLQQAIDRLDVRQAQEEVRPFLKDPSSVDVWSREFFASLKARIEFPS